MKILFITLSNIGDVIMTLPSLDYLRSSFPQAKITVLCGERTAQVFRDNPAIEKVVVYNKHSALSEKAKLFLGLALEGHSIVVDLRNSLFGALLPAWKKIPLFLRLPKSIKHMQARHLYKVQGMRLKSKEPIPFDASKRSFYISKADADFIGAKLSAADIGPNQRLLVVSPGARSHTKRWGRDDFSLLCNSLLEDQSVRIALVGDDSDKEICAYINEKCSQRLLDLSGCTTIPQLGALIKRANLVITNDSAVLHLASYLEVPLLAFFGPTNELKYGPWSGRSGVVRKDIFCRPCEKAQCRSGSLACLTLIKPQDALKRAKEIMLNTSRPVISVGLELFSRILIVRTDRVGDVVLSTPVVKALRSVFPNAYIAMMCSPYTRELLEGNPYLDEVITYDKDGKHKGWFSSIKFALELRKKRFELAVILHPTNRVHLVSFFAGIRRRLGFARKLSFLLTDRVKHTKQLGEMHEAEYNLHLLKTLGIHAQDKQLFVPVTPDDESYVKGLLEAEGIKDTDKLLIVHPAASCPSKIWPAERFAEAARLIAYQHGFKIAVVSGSKDRELSARLCEGLRYKAIDLSGKLTLRQLAALLKRSALFISNDSGPVHIASAVGTPVISIFGRQQKGLSPKRWGPLGKKSRVLHKDVGCIECLAHNCKKDFACLKAISVDDVSAAAAEIMGS